MGSNFSTLIKQAMAKASIDRREAVRLLGYRNFTKGLRNLDAWLSGERVPTSRDQVKCITVAFDLAEEDIHAAMVQDAEEERLRRVEWRRRDPDYHATIRLIPGFYMTHKLPGTLPLDEALRQAHAMAGGRLKFALNTVENKTYWCDEDGRISSVSEMEPYMSIKGRPFRLMASTAKNEPKRP